MAEPTEEEYQRESLYIQELKKFVNSEAIIKYHEGNEVKEITATIRGINYGFLHVIVMTGTEKILIKNIITMRRKRKGDQKKK